VHGRGPRDHGVAIDNCQRSKERGGGGGGIYYGTYQRYRKITTERSREAKEITTPELSREAKMKRTARTREAREAPPVDIWSPRPCVRVLACSGRHWLRHSHKSVP
jgi:hypothetical protein